MKIYRHVFMYNKTSVPGWRSMEVLHHDHQGYLTNLSWLSMQCECTVTNYQLVIFCTTNSSRVLARERWLTYQNSWKKTQYLLNTLYIKLLLFLESNYELVLNKSDNLAQSLIEGVTSLLPQMSVFWVVVFAFHNFLAGQEVTLPCHYRRALVLTFPQFSSRQNAKERESETAKIWQDHYSLIK